MPEMQIEQFASDEDEKVIFQEIKQLFEDTRRYVGGGCSNEELLYYLQCDKRNLEHKMQTLCSNNSWYNPFFMDICHEILLIPFTIINYFSKGQNQ